MSKYTTQVRFICEEAAGLSESVGYNDVERILNISALRVMNFPFPIFNEDYRKPLCIKILRHYYTREIGFETVGLWKLKFSAKMQEIMPYFNKLYESELLKFDPFTDIDLYTEHDKNYESGENTENNTVSESKTDNWNLYSDTPQGNLNGVRDENYLTSVAHVTNKDNSETENTGNKDFNSAEDFLQHIYGKTGNKSYMELLQQLRETFLNIDTMIIDELKDLFMGVW